MVDPFDFLDSVVLFATRSKQVDFVERVKL